MDEPRPIKNLFSRPPSQKKKATFIFPPTTGGKPWNLKGAPASKRPKLEFQESSSSAPGSLSPSAQRELKALEDDTVDIKKEEKLGDIFSRLSKAGARDRSPPLDDDIIDVENQESDNESEQYPDFEENTQEREELNKLLHNIEKRAFATNNGLSAVDILPKSSPSYTHSTPNKSTRKRDSPDRHSLAGKSLPNSLERVRKVRQNAEQSSASGPRTSSSGSPTINVRAKILGLKAEIRQLRIVIGLSEDTPRKLTKPSTTDLQKQLYAQSGLIHRAALREQALTARVVQLEKLLEELILTIESLNKHLN